VDLRGDRALTLRYFNPQGHRLQGEIETVLEHLAYLWGFMIRIEEVDAKGDARLLGSKLGEKRRSG